MHQATRRVALLSLFWLRWGMEKLGEVKGIRIYREEGQIVLERRWYTPMALAFLLFPIIFLTLNYFSFPSISKGAEGDLLSKLFPLIFFGVPIGFAYYALALLLNRTEFRLSNSELVIEHKPLPWLGSGKVFPRSEIAQIYVKEMLHQTKSGASRSYTLMYVNLAQSHEKLVSGIVSDLQALKLEQELEEALGIRNAEVRGEYR
jgi:hypothetical protein